jgi:hypothetical protein
MPKKMFEQIVNKRNRYGREHVADHYFFDFQKTDEPTIAIAPTK